MPGVEAIVDGLLAVVIGALIVIRIRADRARRDVPLAVAIASGVVLGVVTVSATAALVFWILGPA